MSVPAPSVHKYEDDILEHVVPIAPFIGPKFVLMQDNARPQIVSAVRVYLKEH